MQLRIESPVRTSLSLPSRSQAWIRALRLHFILPSILPGILGGVIAWSHGYPLKWIEFLLTVAGVAVNHCGLNMVDDVFDYFNHVDRMETSEKNPFTGGSGVLTAGWLSAREMLVASAICFVVTILIGLYLASVCGGVVLIFGLLGMASSVFYTMPPVKFGYRGFGELGLLINFGPVIVLGAYFVQAGNLSWEPFWVSFVLGLMMWSMILINEIPDFEADRQGGKYNLVVRLGKKRAVELYKAGLILAYLVPVLGVLCQRLSPYTLLMVAGVPLAWRSVMVLQEHRDAPLLMAPANLAMIKVHALTGLALIAAYLLQGLWPIALPV